MKPVLFLRIASVLTLIHALVHTAGQVFSKPSPGAAQEAALVMRSSLFIAMGMVRSYWGFYKGFGFAVSLFLTVEAIVFWQLAALAGTGARGIRPILATFFLGYVTLAAISYRYFVLPPVIVELLIAACLGAAFFTAKPAPATDPRTTDN